jgi:undecaprenyl phosphate-alpha-L-ara4FN deformylase
LDELIGRDDLRDATPAATLSQATEHGLASGHVFTLHAEIEGGQLRDAFGGLLSTWKAQGYAVGTLEESHAALDLATLPRCLIAYGSVPGRSGMLAVQGDEAGSPSAS